MALEDADPVLPVEVVLRLARRHVLTASAVTAVDESGRKGRAYFIDDSIVLKTHRPARLRARVVEEFETSLEKEAFFLSQLARDASIPAPEPLGYGRENGVEYVCMTRVPGVPLRRADLTSEQRQRVLCDLGRTLRRLHALPLAPFSESGLFAEDGGSGELKARLETLFSQIVAAANELPEEWRLRLSAEEVAARALEALPDTTHRAPLHSNPAGEHIFVNLETVALSGLIDFGDAYISHPAFDLRPWRNPADRSAVYAGYTDQGPVDDAFARTWRVGLILGELASVLRRREPPGRAEDNLHSLLQEI